MCGIAGVFACDGAGAISEETLAAMADVLECRGPDDRGFWTETGLGFGFRRLSIIDLSDEANQPFFNEDGSVVSICNGEIYNYRELREELIQKGHRFRSQCDVEILPHLYEEYGCEFIERLNGQFAFSIYDKRRKQLVLARDHVGIAPLFYTQAGNLLLFGSEIKALLKHPAVKREVDLTGLDQMFSFPGVVSPRTLFRGIHALKPGHYLLAQDGQVSVHEYWDLIYPEMSEIGDVKPDAFYCDLLDEALTDSVKRRLVADVPVGFYLSGGLDSSLIAGLIHQISPDVRHSFSIGFTDGDIDERRFQKVVSEKVGSIHHETVFDWDDISNRLMEAVYRAETPLKESYDTCSLALSALVRQNDLKVVLTGEGSDEMFAGYVGYRFDQTREGADGGMLDVEQMLEQEIRTALWGDPDFLYERDQYAFREIKSALYSECVNGLFSEFDSVTQPLVDLSKLQGRHPVHKRSYIDFKLRLSDHLLADHGDRVAYANSVEARYPFLDIQVIEAVKKIPPQLMLKNSVEKYILKEMARSYVPKDIIEREKFAFVAPGSPYLIRQDIEWVNDLLSYDTIKRQGYFNPDTIERLKQMYRDPNFQINQTFDNDLLMIVLTFSIFLEQFEMPDFN